MISLELNTDANPPWVENWKFRDIADSLFRPLVMLTSREAFDEIIMNRWPKHESSTNPTWYQGKI